MYFRLVAPFASLYLVISAWEWTYRVFLKGATKSRTKGVPGPGTVAFQRSLIVAVPLFVSWALAVVGVRLLLKP